MHVYPAEHIHCLILSCQEPSRRSYLVMLADSIIDFRLFALVVMMLSVILAGLTFVLLITGEG